MGRGARARAREPKSAGRAAERGGPPDRPAARTLPALGAPTMTTRGPSRSSSPRRASASASPICCASCRTRGLTAASTSEPRSSASSPKSITASVCARQSRICARQLSKRARASPPICASACLRCASVLAARRSERPSTSVRSIRPFPNARRVNSPRSARRWPGSVPRAASTAETTAGPPCTCSSATSSPVNERGAGNQRTSAESSRSSELGERTLVSVAILGTSQPSDGSLRPRAVIRSRARRAPAPDTRITATPARTPAPDETAKIVSRVSGPAKGTAEAGAGLCGPPLAAAATRVRGARLQRGAVVSGRYAAAPQQIVAVSLAIAAIVATAEGKLSAKGRLNCQNGPKHLQQAVGRQRAGCAAAAALARSEALRARVATCA